VSDDEYQFCVGDIVIEKDFITIGDGSQMTGIIIAIEHLDYNLGKKIIHDRLTIRWLDNDTTEEMPSVLVDLVSSVRKIEIS
tara:strand:- start:558 stop:803 length:246 start_codon:yes stop_codon:yes gene_type:complete